MKSNKKIIISVLCLALVFMGIGFAAFSTALNLSGTATASGTFDVKITNVVLDTSKKTSGATNTTPAVGNNYAVTEQNLSATFSEPGDYITWNITVTNKGTIEAAITVDVNMLNDANGAYKLECDITEGTTLAPNATTTFPCEMSFDKNFELTAQEFAALPKATNVNMQVRLRSVQKANYVAPAAPVQACYTALNETKTLGKINGSTKTTITGANDVQVGDLIGYGTSDIDSNEQFYVIGKSGSTLTLLSKYDINIGPHQKPWDNCSRDTRGYQDKTISLTRSNVDAEFTEQELETLQSEISERGYLYGSIQFYDAGNDDSGYWWDDTNNTFDTINYPLGSWGYPFVYNSNSYIKTYVDQYRSNLTTLGLTGITNASLISYDDVGRICNWEGSSPDFTSCPDYIYNTSYWLGTATSRRSVTAVVALGIVGDGGFENNTISGIRPVITLTIS